MSQRITESYVNSNIPNAYFSQTVKSGVTGVAVAGNIVIIGEADGGPAVYGVDSTDGDILKNNYYTPSQVDSVIAKYVSGNIVEAFRGLSVPSADADIVGAPSRIYIAKTNKGTKSSAVIASTYGTLKAKNFGPDGDKYFYQITSSQLETPASITSTAITYGALEEEGGITVAQATMTNEDYFFIEAQDGTTYCVSLDVTGDAGATLPTGAVYAAADYKADVDVSGAGSDAALATLIINKFNTLTGFTAKVTLVDNTSAVIGINQVSTGVVSNLPTAYNTGDTATGAAVNSCAADYVSTQTGDAADGTFLNGLNFSVRYNGGAIASVTLSGTEADHDTVAELAAEIDGLLPSGLGCTYSSTSIIISADALAVNAALALSYGRSFELIDSTPGDLAAIGLTAQLVVSSAEPEIQLDINRQDINLDEEFIVPAEVVMYIGYEGATATMTISGNTLSTTVTGGSGTNLSIDITKHATLKDLGDYINSQTGYTCTTEGVYSQKPSSVLDKVTAIGICSTASSTKPGRVKNSAYNFANKISQSSGVDFTATATSGLPQVMAAVAYLTGGAKGSTTAANVVSAINDLETIQTNFVIPLFSRNATDDIADSLTEAGSTYTIDAVNALVKSHVLKMSSPKLKRHRSGFCSYWDIFANIKIAASALSHYRLSLACQKTSQVNVAGEIESFQPWYTACIAAGMQAAGGYKPIVKRLANVISLTDPTGFDSGNPGDLETALDAGLLILEQATIGNRWVSDQTTYGVDTNFVYNSIQAVYCADIISLDLADSFQVAFVGKSVADVDAGAALGYLRSKMEAYRRQKLITASDDAPLGYKGESVTITAPTMYVKVGLKLSTGIYFISMSFEFSQVTSSAA